MLASNVESCLPRVIGQPVLGIPAAVVEAGQVRKNETTAISVPVCNYGAGGADLLVSVHVEATWISAANSQMAVQAGETVEIPFELSPGRDVASGEFEIPLLLQASNAVVRDERTVFLRGRVVEDVTLTVDPQEIDFGDVLVSNHPVTADVQVSRSDGEKARVRDCRVEATYDIENSVCIQRNGSDRIEVIFHSANREPGAYKVILIIEEEDEFVREATVPLSATVLDVPRIGVSEDLSVEIAADQGELAIPVSNTGGGELYVHAESDADWLQGSNERLRLHPYEQAELMMAYDLDDRDGTGISAPVRLVSNDNGIEDSVRLVSLTAQRFDPEISIKLSGPGAAYAGRSAKFTAIIRNTGRGSGKVRLATDSNDARFENDEIEVPPKSSMEVSGYWDVPDKAEWGSKTLRAAAQWHIAGGEKRHTNHELVVRVQRRSIWRGVASCAAVLVGMLLIATIATGILMPSGILEEPQLDDPGAESSKGAAIEPPAVTSESPNDAPAPHVSVGVTDTGKDLLGEAQSLMEAGQLREASDAVRCAELAAPGDEEVERFRIALAKVFLEQAWNLKSQGQYLEAYDYANEARSLNPTNPETHWVVGWLAADDSVSELDEGIEAFRQFQQLSSDQDRVAEAERAILRLEERK